MIDFAEASERVNAKLAERVRLRLLTILGAERWELFLQDVAWLSETAPERLDTLLARRPDPEGAA